MRITTPLLLIALTACSPSMSVEPPRPGEAPIDGVVTPSLERAGHPTGSSALAELPDRVLAFADPDSGSVQIQSGTTWLARDVGSEPTRLAVVGDDLIVTLRGDGQVVRLTRDGTVVARADVGLEPYGVVSRADGLLVYVAASLSGQVLELYADDLSVRRSWAVPGEPRWLTLAPDGMTLWAASTGGPAPITRVDIASGDTTRLTLPPVTRATEPGVRVTTDARVTGDMAWSIANDALYVPVLYADTTTPITQVEQNEQGAVVPVGDGEGYGMPAHPEAVAQIGKFTPAVVEFPSSGEGRALYAGSTVVLGAQGGFDTSDTGETGLSGIPVREGRTYLSGVAAHPSGTVLAAMEASDLVVVLQPAAPVINPSGLPAEVGANAPDRGGMELVAMAGIRTPGRPDAVLVGTASMLGTASTFVGSTVGRSVVRLRNLPLAETLIAVNGGTGRNTASDLMDDEIEGGLLPDALPSEIARGRTLFTTAVDPQVSAGGVSCSTCHVDGRNDGLTWTFVNGPRQTPSLAGRVSDTAPVTWTQGVGSVLDEARLTITHRMGGEGLSQADEDALVAYVDWTRPVRRPTPDEAAERGRLVFERWDVNCASCHAGARGTDGLTHTLRGMGLNTPALEGVGATGPWLHDGSAATLREALDPARNGGMAATGQLTDAELDDLVAYLNTL